MFPEWHHAVPESAYFKVPEMLKTFRMYPISKFVYVLHWLATRLQRRICNTDGKVIVTLCAPHAISVSMVLYAFLKVLAPTCGAVSFPLEKSRFICGLRVMRSFFHWYVVVILIDGLDLSLGLTQESFIQSIPSLEIPSPIHTWSHPPMVPSTHPPTHP